MPDSRSHRGPDPRDEALFAPGAIPPMRGAVADLSWLLGRGYAEASSLKLVGDRHRLAERQRKAVMRSSCADDRLADRLRRRLGPGTLRGRPLRIDGFNVLTTVEAALGGAVVIRGRDGSLRDIAGMHGTYRRVEETRPAIARIGEALAGLGVGPCCWLLDRPVSNSGRLRGILLDFAAEAGLDWTAELPFDPDAELAARPGGPDDGAVVASADSQVLDHCGPWFPLAAFVVERAVPGARLVDLSDTSTPARPSLAEGRPGQ
ncbi:DUF434 domain-containing protein [Tautonia plasticadhaerens]|uniref:DUF434 domain-containing protein n=1 Tax=Tautonia plasticadhaerens TaxID=2527974 RepID=A0A518HDQ1_9BACT|nr:DUF434 domain-containing protein [Tautonia plasticadhaerens]QDV38981.1 hypothetical protein ElP_69420 [Tautonia plasticadhaerens]